MMKQESPWRLRCSSHCVRYLKGERGLRSVFSYMAVANGAAMGMGPILVAFFWTVPGFTAVMYSFFTAAEFIGRTAGSFLQYHIEIPKKKRFGIYLPEEYRARVNAFQNAMISVAGSILALVIGGLGEILDPRLAVSLAGILCAIASWILIWRNRADVRMVYE